MDFSSILALSEAYRSTNKKRVEYTRFFDAVMNSDRHEILSVTFF